MKKKGKLCLSFMISAAVLTGLTVNQNATILYAENQNTQDSISVTVDNQQDSIQLTLTGYLTTNSWWYTVKEMTVTYADGSKKTMRCILQADNQQGSASIEWGDVGATVTYSEANFDTGAIQVSYQISKDKLIDVESILIDGQEFSLSQETEPTPAPTESPVTPEPDNPGDTPGSGNLVPTVSGKINIDGNTSDWNNISSFVSNDGDISSWKMVRDTEGNLYVEFEGTAITQWYIGYEWKSISITQNGQTSTSPINNIENKVYNNEAHGNSAAPYYVEFFIPASQLSSDDFSITFAGTTIHADDIPVIDGTDVTPPEDNTYKGIVIDGKFDDWNAVTKYDAVCPNPAHPNCLESTAMVLDGDYVYIYIKDGSEGNAGGAGTHSNGKWAITTDLGRTLVLTLSPDGTVSSKANGIQSVHVGSQWEIAIPASELPNYRNSINWGLYGVDDDSLEPFVKDVSNLNGSAGTAGEESPIVIDGLYGDWDNYPYTYYEYATNGTQEDVQDSHTAITSQGKTLYQYVTTDMPAHLNEQGGEFSSAITVRLNQNSNYDFWPRLIAVDSEGNINWNPQLSGLAPGTYTFELVDTQGWGNSPTLAELEKYGNAHYGTMMMTIGDNGRDSCEYSLDLEKVAKKFGLNADDISMVETQFGRIGQQWARTTGASTGPLVGTGLSVGVAAIAYFLKKKKMI